jgi:hypothetical protein
MTREPAELGGIPPHIGRCVGHEATAWHTAGWWRSHWAKTGLVEVESARLQPGGWRDWVLWTKACIEHGTGERAEQERVLAMLEADGGELLTFALVVARKPG